MTSPKKPTNEDDGRTPKKWSGWRLFTAWIVALAVAVAILMAFRHEMVSASEPPLKDGGLYLKYDESARLPLSKCKDIDLSVVDRFPAFGILDYPGNAQEKDSAQSQWCDMRQVWSTTLTVDRLTDDTNTYLGYAATGDTNFGSVGDTHFHYKWRDYTVIALYYQENISTYKQLVIGADTRLPNGLALRVNGKTFRVSQSTVLGSDQNIHAWPLDEELGWTEGQELMVKMIKL